MAKSKNRVSVVGTVIAVAERLSAEEVDASRAVQLARNGLTFTDIGAELLPHIDVRVAQMAVARALRAVLDPDEYEEIRDRNQQNGTTEGGYAMFPAGTDRDPRLVAACDCKSGWADDELTDLVRLALSEECHFVAGRFKGQTSWRVVAQKLNDKYIDRRPMRNANGVMRRYKRMLAEQPDGTVDEAGNL